MSTVTYKNQPAIERTKGAIPLAGTSHVYTVGKVLWPEAVEEFITTLLIPRSLHVCCGKSFSIGLFPQIRKVAGRNGTSFSWLKFIAGNRVPTLAEHR